ncbi:MAG: flagellar export protein FliJ [Desulfovibrionaceae bacterium]
MPKPFLFSLEKVLAYRGQLEDQAKMRLAKAQQAYAAQVQVVENLRRALDDHIHSLYRKKETSAADIWLWGHYKERLEADVEQAERAVLELAQALNKARRELVMRAKDRKLLQKLKDNQKKSHDKDEQDKEQKGFDEMVAVRYRPTTF